MAANPLHQAQRQALLDARWLRARFASDIGSSAHPRGGIVSAYRRARRLAAGPVRASDAAGLRLVLRQLRAELTALAVSGLGAAAERGLVSAEQQLAAYSDAGERVPFTPALPDTATLLDLYLQPLLQQEQQLTGLLLLPGDHEGEILGDAGRVGLLTPAPVMVWAARTLALALQTGLRAGTAQAAGAGGWFKQTIPAIDERTTDCCLQAAGQIQPLDGMFQLTGTPRFADELDWTPFHWNCRTSVALYRREFDDDLTARLRDDVTRERERRATEDE